MATDGRYSVKFRRRREGKTNYKKRLLMVKSGKPRLVIRKTLKSIIVQLVEFHETGDKTLVSAIGKELPKFGWKAGIGNLPAAYLTGLLLAKRAKGKVDEAILDIGMQHPSKGGRIFAALNGAMDGGLKINAEKSVFPKPERLSGKHIGEQLPTMFSKSKESIMKGE